VTYGRELPLPHHALSQALRLDRFETEEVLRKHNLAEDLGTREDYFNDAKTLEVFRASSR
jgi:hypothetical protein